MGITELFGGLELVNERGKIAKRFARGLRKLGHKPNGDIISKVGEAASRMATDGAYLCHIKTERDIVDVSRNTYDGKNSDPQGTCYWNGYSHHRRAIAENPRMTSMFAVHKANDAPLARMWLYHPGPDGIKNGALGFNAYGMVYDKMCRLLSEWYSIQYGKTYRLYHRIVGEFRGSMYINEMRGWSMVADTPVDGYIDSIECPINVGQYHMIEEPESEW